MKRIIAMLLVLVMVIFAFGCAAQETAAPETTKPAESTTQQTQEKPAQADTSTQDSAAQEAEVFTVALILPMSGTYANVGIMMAAGAEYCYKYFLDEIGGFQNKNVEIEFLTLDFEGNSDVATSLFEKHVEEFDACLGSYKTDTTIAIGALATKYQKPYVIIMSTPDGVAALDSDYVFRPTVGDTEVTSSLSYLFKWLESLDDHPYTQIATIFGNDEYGVGQDATMKKIADSYGWELNVRESLATGQVTDASTAINKVKNSGADFCCVSVSNAEAVLVQKQFQQYQCPVPVYAGGAGYGDANYFANTGTAGDWVVCGALWARNIIEIGDPALKGMDYVEMVEADTGLPFVETAGCAWFAMGILLQAIEDAPTLDPTDVAHAIEALDLGPEHYCNLMLQYGGCDFEDVPGTVGTDLRYNQNIYATAIFTQAQNNEWVLVYIPGAPEIDPNPIVWPHVPYGE